HSDIHPFPTRRSSDLRADDNNIIGRRSSPQGSEFVTQVAPRRGIEACVCAVQAENADSAEETLQDGCPAAPVVGLRHPGVFLPEDRKSTRLNSSHRTI